MRKRVDQKAVPQQGGPPLVVAPEILDSSKFLALEARPRKTFRCHVCGAEGATEQSESLCWVCRRLKISAWREADQQLPMSE